MLNDNDLQEVYDSIDDFILLITNRLNNHAPVIKATTQMRVIETYLNQIVSGVEKDELIKKFNKIKFKIRKLKLEDDTPLPDLKKKENRPVPVVKMQRRKKKNAKS